MTYALVERGHHFAEARAALDALGEALPADAEHRAAEPYYRALIARNTGDLRSALPLLRDAEARALRLGLTRRLLSARQAMGLLLNELGRFDEALALFEATSDVPDATPCDRVAVATNQAHALLLLAEPGDRSRLETAKATIARALPEACADALFRGRLFTELALVDLAQDRPNDAKEHLAQARGLVVSKTGGFVVLGLELEGRIALARHDPAAALKAFDEEARISEGSFLARGIWAAMVGRGTALEAQAKREEAVRAYAAAEDALDEAMLLAPLGEGRDTYMRERESSAKRLTDLLLRLGRARDAMLAARRSRGRFFAALQRADRLEGLDAAARARWEGAIGEYRRQRDALDAEAAGDWALSERSLVAARAARKSRERQLRETLDAALGVLGQTQARAASTYTPPEPGTLQLLYHPTDTGWIGFAIDTTRVDAQRIGAVDPKAPGEALARLLLDPFRAAIERAARVKLLTFGAVRAIDIHALPFQGASLAATKLVEYGLDIPPPPVMNSASHALIVADPTGDLAAAAGEADAVEAVLRGRTKEIEVLRGPRATSRDVLQSFASATLFHYAGHGVFGGVGGSDSALPLAAGSRIAVGDILALVHAPRVVVLSACEGGRTAANAAPEGLGLAQAFVAAGSSAVIAPTRVVPDSLAAEIARRLYENGLDDDPTHAAEALERTLAVVSGQSPNADWSAFRLFTP